MTRPLLVCEGLSWRPSDRPSGIDFTLDAGEILGVVAPDEDAARLLDALSGLQPPAGGAARLDGTGLDLHDPAALARAGIARTFAGAPLPAGLDPHGLVLLADRLARGSAVWRLLHRGWSGRDGDDRDANALLAFVGLRKRKGAALTPLERRRADLARALAQRPRLLLLDRPFMGTDPAEFDRWRRLIRTLAGEGIAILIADQDAGRVATRRLDVGG